MWLSTPKISIATTRPPLGLPAGCARYADSLWPSAAVSWIVVPIRVSCWFVGIRLTSSHRRWNPVDVIAQAGVRLPEQPPAHPPRVLVVPSRPPPRHERVPIPACTLHEPLASCGQIVNDF